MGFFIVKSIWTQKVTGALYGEGALKFDQRKKKERSVITKIKKNTAKFEVYRLSWGGGGVQKIEGD